MSLCVSYQKVDNSVPAKKQDSWECLVQKHRKNGWLAASDEIILTQEHTSDDCETFCKTVCGVWHPEDQC